VNTIIIGIVIIILLILLPAAVKIVNEWERGVILRLGRLIGAKGPGLFFIIPFVDRMIKIDLRVVTLAVPTQEIITRDNVTVKVNAVIFFRVIDPTSAVVKVADYVGSTSLISQTTLRNVVGQSQLDDLLTAREKLNQMVQKIVDEHTDPWGIKVSTVEIKDVELAEEMKRSMAAQAEAERTRRAKIIHAEGEFQASEKLAQAAAVIGREPASIQLRYLQTLTEIATEKTNTIIFPIPIDFLAALVNRSVSKPSAEEK